MSRAQRPGEFTTSREWVTLMTRPGRGESGMDEIDFMRLLPGRRHRSVEELAREQGVTPVRSLEDMRADLWDTDEELDMFLAGVQAARHSDLD